MTITLQGGPCDGMVLRTDSWPFRTCEPHAFTDIQLIDFVMANVDQHMTLLILEVDKHRLVYRSEDDLGTDNHVFVCCSDPNPSLMQNCQHLAGENEGARHRE